MEQSIIVNGRNLEASLQVIFIQDEELITAFCPALQLSAYGENELDAKEAFDYALEVFFNDVGGPEGLMHELRKLGWAIEDHTFSRQSNLDDLRTQLPLYLLNTQNNKYQKQLA